MNRNYYWEGGKERYKYEYVQDWRQIHSLQKSLTFEMAQIHDQWLRLFPKYQSNSDQIAFWHLWE